MVTLPGAASNNGKSAGSYSGDVDALSMANGGPDSGNASSSSAAAVGDLSNSLEKKTNKRVFSHSRSRSSSRYPQATSNNKTGRNQASATTPSPAAATSMNHYNLSNMSPLHPHQNLSSTAQSFASAFLMPDTKSRSSRGGRKNGKYYHLGDIDQTIHLKMSIQYPDVGLGSDTGMNCDLQNEDAFNGDEDTLQLPDATISKEKSKQNSLKRQQKKDIDSKEPQDETNDSMYVNDEALEEHASLQYSNANGSTNPDVPSSSHMDTAAQLQVQDAESHVQATSYQDLNPLLWKDDADWNFIWNTSDLLGKNVDTSKIATPKELMESKVTSTEPSVQHITAQLFSIQLELTVIPPSHLSQHVKSPSGSPTHQNQHLNAIVSSPSQPKRKFTQHKEANKSCRFVEDVKFPICYKDLAGNPFLLAPAAESNVHSISQQHESNGDESLPNSVTTPQSSSYNSPASPTLQHLNDASESSIDNDPPPVPSRARRLSAKVALQDLHQKTSPLSKQVVKNKLQINTSRASAPSRPIQESKHPISFNPSYCPYRPCHPGLLHITLHSFGKKPKRFSISLFEGNRLRQGVYLLDCETGILERDEISRIEEGIREKPLNWLDQNILHSVNQREIRKHRRHTMIRIEFPRWLYPVLFVPTVDSAQVQQQEVKHRARSRSKLYATRASTSSNSTYTKSNRVQSIFGSEMMKRATLPYQFRRPSTAISTVRDNMHRSSVSNFGRHSRVGSQDTNSPLSGGNSSANSSTLPSPFSSGKSFFLGQSQRLSRSTSDARPMSSSGSSTPSGSSGSNVITIEEFVQEDFLVIHDPEDNSNPCEEKHMQLSLNLTADHPTNLKPNTEESKKLREIVETSPLQDLRMDQKEILWKFRYHLLSNRHALIKFLRSVDWSNAKQSREARSLLSEWAEMQPLETLELLSLNFKDITVLRSYAVHILKKADNETLSTILLELVQALRYEKDMIPSDLGQFLLSRAEQNFDICNKLNWYFQVEVKADKNPASRRQYEKIARHLWIHLRKTKNERCEKYVEKLARQREFLEQLNKLGKVIKQSKGDRPKKIQKLKKILGDENTWGKDTFFRNISSKLPPSFLTLPVNPSICVSGIAAEKSTIFKSAMNPILLPFVAAEDDDEEDEEDEERAAEESDDNNSTSSHANSVSSSSSHSRAVVSRNGATVQPGSVYRVIYKSGDDLRQDQLAIQMITLMDKLLKRNGLDLKLIPYKVLATSSDTGFVECVTPNKALSSVISSSKGDIAKWIKSHHRNSEEVEESYNNFIRSCAGYSVITYILGVGDRHLDNILLRPNGQLFHIDFGFILGRDPKPFPPPMRLCKEMVVGMKNMPGDSDSENGYHKFIQLCCTSYNIIRRYYKLILNMLILMVDANIPDLMHGNDPMRNIMKVEEKLNPLLSDTEASHFMKSVIHESERAIVVRISEQIHSIAQYVRS